MGCRVLPRPEKKLCSPFRFPPSLNRMIQPWRTLSSKPLLHDRWIDLRADRCATAAGVEISPYYVLTYPDWVHVVALTADDCLVLVEQYRHGAASAFLELPGGVIDPGDASPLTAGERELREETGFAATGWQPVSNLHANPAIQPNRVHTVLATGAVRVAEPTLEDGEAGMTLSLVPVSTVLAGLAAGLLGQSMQVGGVLLALAKAGRISF